MATALVTEETFPKRAESFRAGVAMIALALAGCHMPTAEQRAANERASAAQFAREAAQHAYDRTYDRCIYRVTGPFAAASIEIMRECERQARAAIAQPL